MNEVKEPQINWGGSWTELKLDAFENYVNAYLTIMSAQKQKFSGWPTTIYFDGFAGRCASICRVHRADDTKIARIVSGHRCG